MKQRKTAFLTAALGTLASLASAQTPSAELVSLMDVGFYEQNGNFFADGLCLVFPPDGEKTYELVIRGADGAVQGKAGLQVQRWSEYPVFDGLGSRGVPVLELGKAGSFVMSVDMDGQPITSLPFTIEVEESGDPFQPGETFHREGPWRNLAFLASPAGKPDQPLAFHFWTNVREIPKVDAKHPKANVRVLLNDELVALYKDSVSIAGTKWKRHNRGLVTSEEPRGRHAFTLEKLLARDGAYTVVVEAGEREIKRFPLVVAGGKVQPHPRTSFDTEPHTDYVVPKFVDRSSGSSGGFQMLDVYWLQTSETDK